MNISEPNLSNVATSPAPDVNEPSSPQTEAVDDSRFVMPSISPFPLTTLSNGESNNGTSCSDGQQPTIPLPFLNSNPSHSALQHSNTFTINQSNRSSIRNPVCNNNPQQSTLSQSYSNQMPSQQHPHNANNRFMNSNGNNSRPQTLRHPSSSSQPSQALQSQNMNRMNMGTVNSINGNNMRLHQLNNNQTRNQPQNANNINNVNHIQNKYNTTIINLNGSLNGSLNGVNTAPSTPYYPHMHATAPNMSSMQQAFGGSGAESIADSAHCFEETLNIPYPSAPQNNVNIIRAKARTNAQIPMSPNLTKHGSIMAGKYKIVSVLADGTFSRTVCAQNINTRKLVAIKIMKDKCQYVGVQEAKRLAFFNNKDQEDLCHIVRFIETIHHQSRFCLVLEILGISLFKYLQIHQTTSLDLVRKIAIQLMIAIQYVHSFNQIHADLKPENVLLVKEESNNSTNCKIKVIDFGNSIAVAERDAYFDKFEIQSLYYRAPEVLLGCRFDLAIDIWSIGCILMELVLGKPLFATPNKSSLCEKIHNVLGPFPIHAYQNAKFYKEYFNKPSYITHQSVYSELYTQRYEGIDKILKEKYKAIGQQWTIDHDHFVQFIACLLDLDPKTRMKASDSFFHPFLQKLFPFKAIFSNSNNNNNSNNNSNNSVNLNTSNAANPMQQQQPSQFSLSNIDLSDSDALQKHKNEMCNKHQFGAECTKLPANFRNPLIHQLQQNNPSMDMNQAQQHIYNQGAHPSHVSQQYHPHQRAHRHAHHGMNHAAEHASHSHTARNHPPHPPHHVQCQSHSQHAQHSHPHHHHRHGMNHPHGMHQNHPHHAHHPHAHHINHQNMLQQQQHQQQQHAQHQQQQQQFMINKNMNNMVTTARKPMHHRAMNPFTGDANGDSQSVINPLQLNAAKRRRVISDSQSVCTDFSQPPLKKTKL